MDPQGVTEHHVDERLVERDPLLHAVAERLASAEPAPAVVLVSSRTASSYRRRLADSPALGFVAKSELSGAALSALLWLMNIAVIPTGSR